MSARSMSDLRKLARSAGIVYRYTHNGGTYWLPRHVLEHRVQHVAVHGAPLQAWRSIVTAKPNGDEPNAPPSYTPPHLKPGTDPGHGGEPTSAKSSGASASSGDPTTDGDGTPTDGDGDGDGEGEGGEGGEGDGEGDGTPDPMQAARDALRDALRALGGDGAMPPPVPEGGERTRESLTQRVAALVRAGCTVYLVGPAGSGKTTMGRHVARALQRECTEVSCSGGVTEAQLLGTIRPHEGGAWRWEPTPAVVAYRDGHVLVLDEIDAADPNALTALHGMLDGESRRLYVPGAGCYVERHERTGIVLTANTYGTGADAVYVGRQPLDGATLDRVEVVEVGYDDALESRIVSPPVLAWGRALRTVVVEHALQRIVSTRRLVRATRLATDGVETFDDWRTRFFAPWTEDEVGRVPRDLLPPALAEKGAAS